MGKAVGESVTGLEVVGEAVGESVEGLEVVGEELGSEVLGVVGALVVGAEVGVAEGTIVLGDALPES